MNLTEIGSLIASFVSVGLGIMAIWLSVVFYKMSSQLSESTREAAKGIGSGVERLEKLFDKLYSDTFSMMKDTVSDMRKHIWPDVTKTDTLITEDTEEIADEKLDTLRKELGIEISNLFQKQSATDFKVESLEEDLRNIIDRAINESRKLEIEARETTIRERILEFFSRARTRRRRFSIAEDLVGKLSEEIAPKIIIEELEKMKDEGIITWEDEGIGPTSVIRLVK